MDNVCNNNRKWYLFILVDLGIYFSGLLLTVFWVLLKKLFCRRRTPSAAVSKPDGNITPFQTQLDLERVANEYACFVAIRLYIGELLSTQFLFGRLFLLITTLAGLISVCLYLYEVFGIVGVLERCDPLDNWVFCVDLACNALFLVYFLLRFIGSSGKIRFWFDIFTIVDVFTISQIISSLFFSREWFGLRFLRVIALTKTSLVLQNFKLVKSSTSIRIVRLITLFLCIWIGGAGFMHLLENSGELTIQSRYINQHNVTFTDSLYFIVVTLSTVGYGDIGAVTACGKFFVTFFILIALAVFASFLPELSEFIFSRSSYSGNYHKESGRRHVIVCGHINYDSVSNFLADFFHEDRFNKNVEVVFLNKDEPQEDLKALLKSYLQVKYFQGTVLNHTDLDRVQMGSADACLILANQNCLHPNDEDAGNTMRAISFKNYCYTCPVIVQLLQFENKIYLENIPTWNRRNGDHIICYSEIELGILAQGCLVPGFPTLLTNLFSVRAAEGCHHLENSSIWLKNYMSGTTLEIYSAKLSQSFTNMNYKELVGLCLEKLNLLLIAIEVSDCNKKKTLLINPLNCQKVYSNSVGYFVCDSYKDANNASLYCTNCHSSLKNVKMLRKCKCKEIGEDNLPKIICHENDKKETIVDEFCEKTNPTSQCYHCQWQNLSDCVISNESQTTDLNDHIILCIFSEKESPLIGIKNFLTPLRSTTIPENDLKLLLIIADKEFIEKEWFEISCFPKIKVVFHSYSFQRMTNLLAIERCSRCVLLNAKSNYRDLQNDLYMVDKEIIIANLYFQSTFNRKVKRRYTQTELQSNFQSPKSATIILMENIKNIAMEMSSPGSKESQFTVPIISKLAIESNVQFLDVKETNVKKIPNYLRKPFAFGYVFTSNMLDSLLSTAYFSPNAISIMEIMITGGFNCEVEDNNNVTISDSSSNRIRIDLQSVTEFNRYENRVNNIFYIDIFVEALKQNLLCLGLYRKRYLSKQSEESSKIDRYVITNPPTNFLIDKSDMVYCLKQVKCNKTNPKL